MPIIKPVFIIGAGRSGTSILYRLLAIHPDLCWFSLATENRINLPQLPVFQRLLSLPYAGNRIKKSIIQGQVPDYLYPSEGEKIYLKCGFNDKLKTIEKNIAGTDHDQFSKIIKSHLEWSGKPRFLTKRTANTQRLRLINYLYPDAIFIHLIRDGRAVADSLVRQPWWPDLNLWWLGQTPRQWWKNNPGHDTLGLAAEHWQHNVKEIIANGHLFGKRYIELRYESLVRNTHKEISRILDHAGLSKYDNYFKILPKSLPDMNGRWQTGLSEKQKQKLTKSIGKYLNFLKYS